MDVLNLCSSCHKDEAVNVWRGSHLCVDCTAKVIENEMQEATVVPLKMPEGFRCHIPKTSIMTFTPSKRGREILNKLYNDKALNT